MISRRGEKAGAFDDEVHAQRLPRQFRRRLGADDLHVLAIDDEDVRIGFLGLFTGGLGLGHGVRGSFAVHLALEAALDGIVFEQIREIVRRNDIADGDHFDVLAHHALFDQRPEHQAPNAAEPVDCYFDCHNFINPFLNDKVL